MASLADDVYLFAISHSAAAIKSSNTFCFWSFVISAKVSVQFLGTKINTTDPDTKSALNYLYNRGITEENIWYYGIGISESSQEWKKRIIFPSFDKTGNLNFFLGRTKEKKVFPTYKNCETDKNEIIFNELKIDFLKEITIVEGPFDMIKSGQNSVPILGSSLSEDSKLFLEILKNNTPVLLGLDKDMQNKSQEIANLFYLYDIDVRILPLGGFKDVGEMSKKDFLCASRLAKKWEKDDKLLYKINSLWCWKVLWKW